MKDIAVGKKIRTDGDLPENNELTMPNPQWRLLYTVRFRVLQLVIR